MIVGSAPAPRKLVVMGVSGCGKSTLARAAADRWQWPMIEGDDFHSPASLAKMHTGIALTDADRLGWLHELGTRLAALPGAGVLACSALKRAYRDILRAHAGPGLRFVHMALSQDEALRRVASRKGHPFPAVLVADQFATLEPPIHEADALTVDATDTTAAQLDRLAAWFAAASPRTS